MGELIAEGRFWSADAPTRRVRGRLVLEEQSGGTLQLVECVGTIPWNNFEREWLLLGEDIGGRRLFTLSRCRMIKHGNGRGALGGPHDLRRCPLR